MITVIGTMISKNKDILFAGVMLNEKGKRSTSSTVNEFRQNDDGVTMPHFQGVYIFPNSSSGAIRAAKNVQ